MASDARTETDDARHAQSSRSASRSLRGRSRALARRLGIEHRHAAGTTLLAAVLALGCGYYAGWLFADFGLRLPALLIVAIAGFVVIYARRTSAGVLAAGLYVLAGLVAITPVVLNLVFVVVSGSYGVSSPWPFVLSLIDIVFLVIFVVLALVIAGIARLVGRRARNTSAGGDVSG